eukprot:TRINITY_DN1551_c0_g1_i1.p1 TRINITY_DN1551_c0_g1~~TRINITY_DN1551_c0_g1_i1.p1  ORF type:complete len:205 (-),score=54.25 TRINITY_DN1551_c0_g1_i1:375-989(-)
MAEPSETNNVAPETQANEAPAAQASTSGSASTAPKEALENALQAFVEQDNKEWNPLLQEILEGISTTGLSMFPWEALKILLGHQLKTVALKYEDAKENAELFDKVLNNLNAYNQAPFTLQRITELALRPERFYKSLRKLLFALEKLVTVITTLPVWDGNPLVDDDNDAQNDDNLRTLPEAVYLDEALVENVPVPMEIETSTPES